MRINSEELCDYVRLLLPYRRKELGAILDHVEQKNGGVAVFLDKVCTNPNRRELAPPNAPEWATYPYVVGGFLIDATDVDGKDALELAAYVDEKLRDAITQVDAAYSRAISYSIQRHGIDGGVFPLIAVTKGIEA